MLQMPEKYVFLIMYYKCVYMVYVKLGKDPNEEIEFGCVVGSFFFFFPLNHQLCCWI